MCDGFVVVDLKMAKYKHAAFVLPVKFIIAHLGDLWKPLLLLMEHKNYLPCSQLTIMAAKTRTFRRQ